MKYRGGSGGEFVKFEKVGDGVRGVVEGVESSPNKFKGTVDTVISVREEGTGAIKKVRCDKRALADAAAKIMAEGGFRRGERIIVLFEATYTSKQFKNNPGKDITIDLPDRDESGAPADVKSAQAAQQAATPAASNPEVEAAYAEVVKAKGEAAAKAIRTAVEGVAKNDPAKQAELLRNAAKAVAA